MAVKDSELIAQAARYIDRPEKFCKGDPGRRLGLHFTAYCGEAAIELALFNIYIGGQGVHDLRVRVSTAILAELRAQCPAIASDLDKERKGRTFIRYYNDHPDMDQPTMHAAFIKARNKALERGE